MGSIYNSPWINSVFEFSDLFVMALAKLPHPCLDKCLNVCVSVLSLPFTSLEFFFVGFVSVISIATLGDVKMIGALFKGYEIGDTPNSMDAHTDYF